MPMHTRFSEAVVTLAQMMTDQRAALDECTCTGPGHPECPAYRRYTALAADTDRYHARIRGSFNASDARAIEIRATSRALTGAEH